MITSANCLNCMNKYYDTLFQDIKRNGKQKNNFDSFIQAATDENLNELQQNCLQYVTNGDEYVIP